MTRDNNIEDELRSDTPALAGIASKSVYDIPSGYFGELADEVLGKINAGLEPVYGFTNNTPYAIPANYFQDLPIIVLQKTKEQLPANNVLEELDGIAPLLNTIDKKQVYSVPQGYFENTSSEMPAPEIKGKVVGFHFTKIYKLATAAVITGILAIGTYLFSGKEDTVLQANNEIPKTEVKNLSEADIVDFLADPAVATFSSALPATEIHDAVKEIPDDEIKQFLQDSEVPEGI